MAKYIDVESLVVAYSGHTPDDEFSKGVDFVLGLLDSKPPADVRPIIRAKWIEEDTAANFRAFQCSWCKSGGKPAHFNFCPRCGAYMRDGEFVQPEPLKVEHYVR